MSTKQHILSAQGIAPFLTRKSLAEKINIFDSLESTDKTAKELAIAGADHGTVIVADHQVAGKGRRGRAFSSPAGHGLYMSIVLRPEQIQVEVPTLVTMLAAVATCEAIEVISNESPQIKWVNDIFIGDKKVCGISAEAVTDLESGDVQWMVVGIGVNFSTPTEDFPEELRQIAGSVFPDGDAPTTRNHLAAEVINRILAPRETCDTIAMLDEYRKRLFILGNTITVLAPNETYEAKAIDIDSMGHLIVLRNTGEQEILSTGEISIKP